MLGVFIAIICCVVVFFNWHIRTKRASCPKWNEISTDTIKVGASKKKLETFQEAGPIDYIIIGSGLGGLTTASLLSKAGYRVLMLEQHDVAGGATHTFEEKGFVFDVGVHYLGERLSSWWSPCRRLFDAISDGKLEWSQCHPNFDTAVNQTTGMKIAMNKDPSKTIETLEQKFPGCGPSVRRYRRACQLAKLSAGVMGFLKILPRPLSKFLSIILRPIYGWAAERTAAQVMKNCGLSSEVIGALTYLYGDYGMPPSKTPFMVQAMVGTHYDGGAFFPRGGSESIAKTIVASIQRNGGCVMVRAEVKQILTKTLKGGGHKAVGVRCKDVDVMARVGVISNAGAYNTFNRLLQPEVAASHLVPLTNRGAMQPSVQLVYLFIGFDCDDQSLNLPGANFWLVNDWDHDEQWKKFQAADSYEDLNFLPAVFLSFGSAKDDAFAKVNGPNKATMQILAPVKIEWFEDEKWKDSKVKHRGKDYESLKAVWKERLLGYLYQHFPQCKGHVVFTDLATPLTTNYYLNTHRGETYGIHHDMSRFSSEAQDKLHTTTDVKNLYMVGQDNLCCGVIAVLASGAITASHLSIKSIIHMIYEILFA